MRAFVRMREMLIDHQDLLRKIQDMELKYDDQFHEVFDAIRALTEPPEMPRRRSGLSLQASLPVSRAAADPRRAAWSPQA
jgi:hypothetical protein